MALEDISKMSLMSLDGFKWGNFVGFSRGFPWLWGDGVLGHSCGNLCTLKICSSIKSQ